MPNCEIPRSQLVPPEYWEDPSPECINCGFDDPDYADFIIDHEGLCPDCVEHK